MPRALIRDAARLLSSGEISSETLLSGCASVLQDCPLLHWTNAYIHTETEESLLQQLHLTPPTATLRGLPIAVKDNFCTAGIRTTAGSRMLSNFIPTFDAAVVERLREAGAVVTGKANMDEFAMGSAGITSYFGPTRNPTRNPSYNPTRLTCNPTVDAEGFGIDAADFVVPGGSSSGSAVAVSVDSCFAAVGSDTGGSVRLPAAFCGLVGLKPSYGRISRWGLISYASSLDCPGILARSVQDAALLLDILAAPDTRDATCIQEPFQPVSPLLAPCASQANMRGIRVGVPVEFYVEELPEKGVTSWREAIKRLQDRGAEVEEVSIPAVKDALATYYVLAASEASSNLARYDGVQFGYRSDMTGGSLSEQYAATRSEGFGEEVQKRVMMGSYVLSQGAFEECYEKAVMLRKLLTAQFDEVFSKVDALVSPVSPFPAPLASQLHSADQLDSYVIDCMTVPASLAGIPAVAVPFGPNAPHVPESIQVMAPYKKELTALKVAQALEA